MLSTKRNLGTCRLTSAVARFCEQLEPRRLLCTLHMNHVIDAPIWSDAIEQQYAAANFGGPEAVSIVWANRGQTSDNFAAAFGTSAAAARNVVDAAFRHWERVITSFNRSDGTSTLQINVSIATDDKGDLVGGFGGSGAPDPTAPADGKPRTGSFSLTAGNINSNPNDSNGWYFDPNPDDWAEFDGAITNAFAGQSIANLGSDFYSVAVAELTHVLGLISANNNGEPVGYSNYRLETSGFATNTNIRDNAEGGGNFGHFWTFQGPTISHLMTSYNSGDATDASWGNIIHSAGVRPTPLNFGGQMWQGSEDAGNAAGGGNERVIPSWVMTHVLADAYGYTVSAPETFGTFYVNHNRDDGTLRVRGGAGNSADVITVSTVSILGTTFLSVSVDVGDDIPGTRHLPGAGNLPAWTSTFIAGTVSSINIDAGGGDDYIRIDGNAGKPITINGNAGNDIIDIGFGPRNLNLVTGNITIFGGGGQDAIYIYDNNSSSGRIVNVYSNQIQMANSATINYSGVEALTYTGGSGGDSMRVASLNIPLTFNGMNGDDFLRPGFNEATMQHSLANINATITFNGGNGFDSMILRNEASTTNWFHQVNNGSVVSLGPGGSSTVSIPGVERVEIAGGSGDDFMMTSPDANYSYVFRGNDGNDSFDVRGGSAATLFGGNGDDRFYYGGGNLGPSVSNITADGGPGHDTMVLDDSNSTHNFPWAVYGNTGNVNTANTVFLGLNAYGYAGFEGVEILAGNGNNEFQLHSTTAALTIDGGGGNDTFKLENFYNRYEQGLAIIMHPVHLNGGSGTDAIIANDQPRNQTTYTLEPHRLRGDEILTQFDYDITYANINSMSINASNAVSNLNVLGTPASITSQISFFGNGGNDNVTITPRDAQGNLTINGTLGIFGGSGTDTVTINGTTSSVPLDLKFLNLSGPGTANITGLGAGGFGIFSDVENIVVNGGSGNDVFTVESFKTGNALAINGNAGDDTLRVGNGNLSGNVTSISSFSFNGGAGSDSIHIDNANAPGGWSYARQAASVSADNNAGYFVGVGIPDVEHVYMNGGAEADTFVANAVPVGTSLTVDGGAGLDVLSLFGDSMNIQGPITFDGAADGGRIAFTDFSFSGIGRTLHLNANSLGAHPGDTLFGPGGAVYFSNLAHSETQPGVLLSLGSGPDTIYATPLASSRVTINANNPTSAPGDTLHLLLAGVQDHVINSTGVGAGNVTSSNRQTLNWTGIESGPFVIIEAPTVQNSSFEVNTPQQQLRMEFSANVSASLTTSSISLMNLTTSQQVPAGNMALSYDAGTNTATFTFPGYTHGVLPDGNYRLTLPAGAVTDPNGNPNQTGHTLDFFFLNGDANRDGVVNLADFNILAANFGQSPRIFSQGDFNYDGIVNLADFNILAGRFGVMLSSSALAAPPSPFGQTQITDTDSKGEPEELLA